MRSRCRMLPMTEFHRLTSRRLSSSRSSSSAAYAVTCLTQELCFTHSFSSRATNAIVRRFANHQHSQIVLYYIMKKIQNLNVCHVFRYLIIDSFHFAALDFELLLEHLHFRLELPYFVLHRQDHDILQKDTSIPAASTKILMTSKTLRVIPLHKRKFDSDV